ncbi:MAG: flap endonuclease [Actinobacteria bacterium]|nr:flap endonuclease [Actinomycetota bacterium]
MQVHLIDGTYEMYRQHYGSAIRDREPPPFAATIGVLSSTLQLLIEGATHIGVATDHVIESFRNDLYGGYKTSEGMEPVLLEQIPILEDALRAMGVTVWAMEKYEADDALASAVATACEDRRVHQVRILTPDKDLGQCVSGRRVVQVDRRNNLVLDEKAIREKFGIGPDSIPDYLALVGDSADGFPGLPGWGAKSASTVLAKYLSLDDIPKSHEQWLVDGLKVRGAEKLAATLRENKKDAELFRTLATLVRDVPVGTVDSWRWKSETSTFDAISKKFGGAYLSDRLARAKAARVSQ